MFKGLTIGQKIGMGFGVMVVLLTVVGAISYVSVAGIGDSIPGKILDGNLAQKEVDHLTWANKVSALLTDDGVTELHVQTDPHKCGFGEWLYGDGRLQAEQQIPSIAPMLKEIEQYHSDLHGSAVEIGEAFSQPHPGLAEQLTGRWADHVGWVGDCSHGLALAGTLYAYQNRVQNVVEAAMSIVEAAAADESLGSEEARQERAKELLRVLRYGPEGEDYVWINDMSHHMVMHPIKPQLEGNNLVDLEDPNGKKLVQEFVKVCENGSDGYVTYVWPYPGTDVQTPKISYVQLYEPWGWVLGTGVFISEQNDRFLARVENFASGARYELGVQMDPKLCAFGKFLNDPATQEMRKGFPEFDRAIRAIQEPHDRLHSLGVKIEDLVTARQTAEAVSLYEQEVVPALAELKGHFDEAIAAEEHLRKGAQHANRVFATKTKPNLEKVQQILNQIRDEVKRHVMSDEEMLASAHATKRNVTAVGIVAIISGIVMAFFISKGIVTTLKRVIAGLSEGADQINDASGQVSTASQQLAEGACEQAASLEETSSALNEMASMTRTNADTAQEADGISRRAMEAAQSGDQTMEALTTAMTAINESSGKISKIIKVVEEIAFQTNLLALNAAVEAARAGEHGKGFAVVAEEVRGLARRCAEAAGETASLIEDSVAKAHEGTDVAAEVGNSLEAIVSDVTKVTDLIAGIARASKEQAQGVDQVNSAVSQIDGVTQQNAAAAEESASAAEELTAQAEAVRGMVCDLSALVGGQGSVSVQAGVLDDDFSM